MRSHLPANDDPDGPDPRGAARARVAIWLIATAGLVVVVFMAIVGAHAGGELIGPVVSVHDGDTLTVLVDHRQVRVRLVDIDAPELGQAFGRRSRDSLAGMCSGVTARVVDQGRDRYGRTLGRVTCGPRDANAEQVRRGMAWVFVRYAPKSSPLYAVQTEARIEHRGLWTDAHPVAPWDWRAQGRAISNAAPARAAAHE